MKRALISVYDKTNVVELAEKLNELGYEIISTGGTYKELKKANINVVELSKFSGEPEILNGRVKSLHPKIFGGILSTGNEADILPIDIVVVNLYPFDKAMEENLENSGLVEYIDIGGVSLLRAGAKNYERVTAVPSVKFYDDLIKELKTNDGETTLEFRKLMALKSFETTAVYDGLISQELNQRFVYESEFLNFNLKKKQGLRYGENPHQKASLYSFENDVKFELLGGKELSFNNILDMTTAMNVVTEFIDVPACAVVKHTNPCGIALGDTIEQAYLDALYCDPISAFGGIIAFNQPVSAAIAKQASKMFLEVLIAPDFTEDALDILEEKKNLRLVKVSDMMHYRKAQRLDIKLTPFGALVQDVDRGELSKDTFKVVTTKKPTAEQIEDMIFGVKVVKHLKSNAIVVIKDKKTIGIGSGQTSRIKAMELALAQACENAKDAVIASDGFLPAVDNIQIAAQNRISAIIQPGGSIKDNEVIEQCNNFEITMITTSLRSFKH